MTNFKLQEHFYWRKVYVYLYRYFFHTSKHAQESHNGHRASFSKVLYTMSLIFLVHSPECLPFYHHAANWKQLTHTYRVYSQFHKMWHYSCLEGKALCTKPVVIWCAILPECPFFITVQQLNKELPESCIMCFLWHRNRAPEHPGTLAWPWLVFVAGSCLHALTSANFIIFCSS